MGLHRFHRASRGHLIKKVLAVISLVTSAIWVWIGEGLVRALPRAPQSQHCVLPLGLNERPLGFLEGTDILITFDQPGEHQNVIRVWDSLRNVPTNEYYLLHPKTNYLPPFSARHRIVIGEPAEPSNTPSHLSALHLQSGRWVDLTADSSYVCGFHALKPLVCLTDSPTNERLLNVDVVDCETGQRVFKWRGTQEPSRERYLTNPPLLLSSLNAILLPVCSAHGQSLQCDGELWQLNQPLGPPTIIRGFSLGENATASDTSMVAYNRFEHGPEAIEVYDVAKPGVALAEPPESRSSAAIDFQGQLPRPILSPDGRTLLHNGTLWDLNKARILWKQSTWESVDRATKADRFLVNEHWDLFPHVFVGRTQAVRALSTGRLLSRMWISTDQDLEAVAGRPFIEGNTVYLDRFSSVRGFAGPNWPLWLLCQGVLGIPVVFTWMLLYVYIRRQKPIAGTTLADASTCR